jgi:hypothetical protein
MLLLAVSASAAEIELAPVYGFSSRAKIGCWTPVTVEIVYSPRNPADTLDAELRLGFLTGEYGDHAAYNSVPLAMGAGRKKVTLCFVQEEGQNATLVVSLHNRVDGAELRRVQVVNPEGLAGEDALLLRDDATLVVALGDGGDRFCLNDWRQSRLLEAATHNLPGFERDNDSLVVAGLREDDAPDVWAGYQGVDAIIWDAVAPGKMRPAQLAALRDWVARGGRLALVFREGTELAALGKLLPGKITRRKTLVLPRDEGGKSALPEDLMLFCAGQWQYDGGLEKSLLVGDAEVEILELSDVEGKVLARCGGEPALVRKTFGAGSVTLLAVDPGKLPRGGAAAMLGRATGVAFDPLDVLEIYFRNLKSDDIIGGKRHAFRQGQSETVPAARHYLSASPSLSAVSFKLVAGFLLAYFLLAGPVEYYLLAKFRLKRFAWTVFVLQIILFSAVAYGGAIYLRGDRAIARVLRVNDYYPAAGLSQENIFTGIYASAAGKSDLDFGGDAWPVCLGDKSYERKEDNYNDEFEQEPEFSPGGCANGLADQLARGRSTVLRGVPFRQWSMRCFASVSIGEEMPPVIGEVKYSGRELTGELTAGTELKNAVLIGRLGVYKKTDWRAGEKWRPDKPLEFSDYMRGLLADSGYVAGSGGRNELALARKVEILSFARCLNGWRRMLLMQTLLRSRPEKLPALRLAENRKDIVLLRSEEPPLAAGLTLEQIWNMKLREDERYLPDLSEVIREGGVVLLAQAGFKPGAVAVAGKELDEEGACLLRIIYPAGGASGGGDDDLYGSSYQKVW